MRDFEREEAYKAMKLQEALKDPAFKKMHERNQRKAVEERKRLEMLKNCGINGYMPPKPDEKPKQKTAEEMKMESILKHYLK